MLLWGSGRPAGACMALWALLPTSSVEHAVPCAHQLLQSPSQRSLHNAPIFRLLLKVAVNGTHQCDFLNFCGGSGPQHSADLCLATQEVCRILSTQTTWCHDTPSCVCTGSIRQNPVGRQSRCQMPPIPTSGLHLIAFAVPS